MTASRKTANGKSLINSLSSFFVVLCVLAFLAACGSGGETEEPIPPSEKPNFLTDAERDEGWILLFNGRDFEGWRGLGRGYIPEGQWTIEDESIKKIPSGEVPLQADGQPLEGGDILTERTFTDFELRFQWKISSGLGHVYATTTVRARDQDPRDLSIVELDEGFRMMSAVIGVDPTSVRIGMPVQVTFDDQATPYFVPR